VKAFFIRHLLAFIAFSIHHMVVHFSLILVLIRHSDVLTISVIIVLPHLVSLLVGSEVGALSEPFKTVRIRTDVRLFAGVSSQMGAEVEVKREALLADLTFVRPFTSVDELVALEFAIV